MKYIWDELKSSCNELDFSSKVFKPTGTTQILFEGAMQILSKEPKKILEIGCGSGVVSLGINHKSLVHHDYFLSDVSSNAVFVAKHNFDTLNIKADIRESDVFDKWKGQKFDIIISDISGVPEAIADIFSWFDDAPNGSGADGTLLSLRVIEQAHIYLNEGGVLIFPIISLSNSNKLKKFLSLHFSQVRVLSEQSFPLQIEKEKVEQLQEKYTFIDIKNVGPWYTFNTIVYSAGGLYE